MPVFCSIYEVGSKLGPFAAFASAPTNAPNCHFFRQLLGQLAFQEENLPRGSRSQAKQLKTKDGAPTIWEKDEGIHKVSGDPLTHKLFSMHNLVGERGFEPPTPWSRTRCSTRLSHSPTLSC